MLKRLGFTNLYGCDFVVKPRYNPTLVKMVVNMVYRFYKSEYLPIVQMYYDNMFNLSIQNLEKTSYHDNIFDYVTSVSVIEHGVNISEYFREMSRVLKKGGCLLTSTDYWPEKITNTNDLITNEKLDNVFCRSEIESMVEIAEKYGLRLIEPIDYIYEEKLVSWEKTGLDYTFIFFGMRKE
jgi:ubiquinone/menaquinone biosynthesis C-methylase UbiE